MLIVFILILGFIGIVSHYGIKVFTRGVETDIQVKETLIEVIQAKGYNTSVKEGSRINPAYDYSKDQVEIQSGTSIQHVAQGFHELGHAMDAYNRNLLEKEYGIWSGILFYIMKYSLPIAVFSHALLVGTTMDYLLIPTYILILLSLVFTTVTLKEEIVASKYAILLMKEKLQLTNNQWGKAKASLFGGLISYLVLILMAYTLLGFQLFNDFYFY